MHYANECKKYDMSLVEKIERKINNNINVNIFQIVILKSSGSIR